MDSTLYGPFTQELGLMILVDSFQSRTSWKLCKQRFILTMLNVLCSQDKKNGTLMQLCCWRTVAGAAGASPGWWQVHMDLRQEPGKQLMGRSRQIEHCIITFLRKPSR